MADPSLEALRCFVEAAHTLNFRKAARVVALSPAALGQRIRQLEEQVGARLFDRTTRSVALTEQGLALVPYAQRALEAVSDCTRAVHGELELAPMEIVIGTRHELGMSWLMPMLPSLRHEHSSVLFNIYFSSGPDLVFLVANRQIDCAITSTRITDPTVDFIKLHTEKYVFVGARKLLEREPLSRASHAENHDLIDVNTELSLFRYWRDAPGGIDSLAFRRVVRMGTIAAIRFQVLKGEGVAVLPLYFVEKDLEAGRLQRILTGVRPNSDFFRLIFRGDDPRRPALESIAGTMLEHPLK